ncbi:isovaleryl-CoA dehydrogenase, partial [Klebsiella pneumoniae]|nr:isovaleryl-CoA dehydrogenase [Klebsiella pneumoniae]
AWGRREDARESAWARLITPAVNFAIGKPRVPSVAEAVDVLGGIGYCVGGASPGLYRGSPGNSVWDGSGSLMWLSLIHIRRV